MAALTRSQSAGCMGPSGCMTCAPVSASWPAVHEVATALTTNSPSAAIVAAMAATMAAEGLLVVKAVATSWTAGQLALTGANVMHPDGPMQPADWDRVSAAMRQAASGGDEPRVAFKPRQPVTVDVFPREEGQALLEVRAPHRIGLLWATCSWLAEHGCTVNAAFIEASGGIRQSIYAVEGTVDAAALRAHLAGRAIWLSPASLLANALRWSQRRLRMP